MRLKETLSLRKIADEYIAILAPDGIVDYTKAIALNDSAAMLIQETASEEFTPESWTALLLEHYNVSPEQARQDVDSLIHELSEVGLLA